MIKLLGYLKGYWVPSILGPIFKLMEAAFELIIPLLVAKVIDVGIANGDTAYIFKMGGLMIGLGALGLGFSLTCQYLAARASMGFGANLRSALYRHVNKLSFAEIDSVGSGGLITRLSSDVNQTQTGVAMFIRLVLRAPFIVIGAIVMAMTINLKMSLIFIAMAVVVSVMLFFIMTRSTPYYRTIQKKLDDIASLTRENLTGARVVRAFSNQADEEKDFAVETKKLSKINIKVGLIAGLLNPLTYAVINVCVILVLWLGSKQVYYGTLSQGQIAALVNYLSQILLALVVTATLAVTFTKAAACANRISRVFAITPSMTEGDDSTLAQSNQPKIMFNNVSLAYNESGGYSLKNLTFSAFSGESIGIIGGTGSGKTTLVSLIPRFYDTSEGSVAVDGINVRDYRFDTLRKKIGLVPQKATIFSGTVRDNMQWGKEDATDEEIWEALKIAQAADFVSKLDHGLGEVISQGGKNLSGGQKQRLTIARALIRKPEILIFDDSSSALDYETDSKLRSALKRMDIRPTIISVSQRATSIRYCDKILVLDNGVCVGLGTHDELEKSCPIYQEICSSQTSDASKKSSGANKNE